MGCIRFMNTDNTPYAIACSDSLAEHSLPVGDHLDKRVRMQRFILRLSCPDRMGIVAAVGAFLLEHQCNIVESAQFGDQAQRFFMRVSFDCARPVSLGALQEAVELTGEKFGMQW